MVIYYNTAEGNDTKNFEISPRARQGALRLLYKNTRGNGIRVSEKKGKIKIMD